MATSADGLITTLLVEDCAADRERLRVLLTRMGVNAVCVADARQAMKRLQNPFYDIVLCDWELPGGNGLDICRYVAEIPLAQRPYFIMLTGRSQPADVVAAMDAGADDFIRKPAASEELRVRVNAALRAISWRQVVRDAGLSEAVNY